MERSTDKARAGDGVTSLSREVDASTTEPIGAAVEESE